MLLCFSGYRSTCPRLFYDVQELGSMLLVPVHNRHFLPPAVDEAVIVILMDGLVVMSLLFRVGCWPVVHHADRNKKKVQHRIRGRIIVLFGMMWMRDRQVTVTFKCCAILFIALDVLTVKLQKIFLGRHPWFTRPHPRAFLSRRHVQIGL